MPDLNKVEIAIVLDRSGSMQTIRKDMEQGLVAFLQEQAKLPGQLVVSLFQFDHSFEVVFQEKPAAEVQNISLLPRGLTALYDAVGHAIDLVGARLAEKPEDQRPGGVIVLIITDGEENSPKKFSFETVQEMIKHQKEVYQWQFAYLGSDMSTKSSAAALGVSSRQYTNDTQGVKGLMGSTSRGVAQYRLSRSAGQQADLDIDNDPA